MTVASLSINEMYGKLLEEGYKRHPGSLCRVFVRLGYRKKTKSTKKVKAFRALRHTGRFRHQMANGCKICTNSMLCGTR